LVEKQSRQVLQDALVGLIGALFRVIIFLEMVLNEEVLMDTTYWRQHFIRISRGAIDGYIASQYQITYDLLIGLAVVSG